jgi:CheY-like chemotaxis protein
VVRSSSEKGTSVSVSTLLVDDNKVLLEMLKKVFEEKGFRVVIANSAQEAIAALSKHRFELVVTDIRMENSIAGFEVIRAAKAQASPPIVAILSAFPLPAGEWRRTGADAFLLKAGSIADRLDDFRTMVERRRTAG